MRLIALASAVLATSATAQDLTIQFSDGAPKDQITLVNAGCTITDALIVVDLTASWGKLIFDVTSQGAGVEVFQPVEITSGDAVLGPISDGDKQLQIVVRSFARDSTISLTADLDDTLDGSRQITVSGSEIAGATMSLTTNDRALSGTFDVTGTAQITMPDAACTLG